MTPLDMIAGLQWSDLPAQVRRQTQICLLDVLGIAAGGHGTRLSGIIRDHAVDMYGGAVPLIFDSRTASAAGVALATGMSIDSLDGHDGFNPAKGHIGAPLFATLLPMAQAAAASGTAFLTATAIGYEIGARVAMAQHATVPDYHTSGSWGATMAAAAGARLRGLDRAAIRHAMGIAEYHGPRSQMMRCIDHPTMLKDGAGWGAMCAVAAVDLAARGFTGAPAITIEDAPDHWADLGQRWYILEQYYKPYPVCRWAQAPVEGVLALRRAHGLTGPQVARIEVHTFHESVRLATRRPRTTEEAQYSTSFPVAVAMARGALGPADIADDALEDAEVLRLSEGLEMHESPHANANFPADRLARVTLHLHDGQSIEGPYMRPLWTAEDPPTENQLRTKFHDLADPVLGAARAHAIAAAVDALPQTGFAALGDLLFQPISPATTSGRSA